MEEVRNEESPMKKNIINKMSHSDNEIENNNNAIENK